MANEFTDVFKEIVGIIAVVKLLEKPKPFEQIFNIIQMAVLYSFVGPIITTMNAQVAAVAELADVTMRVQNFAKEISSVSVVLNDIQSQVNAIYSELDYIKQQIDNINYCLTGNGGESNG